MRFGAIIADPPWAFGDTLHAMRSPTRRSAKAQYPVMSTADIMALDVASLADPAGCVLALWVPGSLVADGLAVAQAWGFAQKQCFVWVKTKRSRRRRGLAVGLEDQLAFGMGRLFRQCHELALVCTSGRSVYAGLSNRSQRSVAMAPNLGHSIKPDCLHASLELMFPSVPRLEMFARRPVPGWTCVGNEVDGLDIRDSIRGLVAM